jgi:AcrR family transcriptional regulator
MDDVYSSTVTTALDHPDRRIRRSRAALRAAITGLVADVGYDKITVADVLLRADVSRGTFYSHYADKDALFLDATEHLLDELVSDVRAVAALDTATLTGAGVRVLFVHARAHRDLYLAMLNGAAGGGAMRGYVARLTGAFQEIVVSSVAAVGTTPRMPVDAIARGWVGEQLALTSWWLEHGADLDVDELTHMRMLLMTQGLTWAVGLEPGKLTYEPPKT